MKKNNNDLVVIHDYIYLKKFNLNLQKLKNSSNILYNLVKNNFINNKKDYIKKSTLSTELFSSYNLLMYPLDEFYELYLEIQKTFQILNKNKENHYIQCWLNYYQKNEFIEWHNHWKEQNESWHGFFCVDCEPSITSYKLPNVVEQIDIHNKNNSLVLSKSDGDEHRTYPWEFDDRPRITIAFDIVPKKYIRYDEWLNHWIPI
jgi:hypothetical protein